MNRVSLEPIPVGYDEAGQARVEIAVQKLKSGGIVDTIGAKIGHKWLFRFAGIFCPHPVHSKINEITKAKFIQPLSWLLKPLDETIISLLCMFDIKLNYRAIDGPRDWKVKLQAPRRIFCYCQPPLNYPVTRRKGQRGNSAINVLRCQQITGLKRAVQRPETNKRHIQALPNWSEYAQVYVPAMIRIHYSKLISSNLRP